jgi:lysophospholipase
VSTNVRALWALPPKGKYGFLDTSDGAGIRYVWWPNDDKDTPRGSVVLLTGRREFIEKHAETIIDLLNRNFAVFAFDWRGQGLSTRALPDRHKGYVRSFDDYLNDMHLFVETIVKKNAPEPYFILGHSMGGHCALRYMHDHPDIIERAVLSAPMVDIGPGTVLHAVLATGITLVTWFGGAKSYALGQKGFDARTHKFAGNVLTSDPGRFHIETGWAASNPDLGLGGPTYGWIRAALKSIRILNSRGYAERIRAPVLMVQAGKDQVVRNDAQNRLAARMPRGQVVRIDGAMHEILHERDEFRNAFWDYFDKFIEAAYM